MDVIMVHGIIIQNLILIPKNLMISTISISAIFIQIIFDIKTLQQLKKDIPVLIHEFPQKFFKNNIEKLGFTVEEIPHNKRTKLGKTWINILAADNCDPKICSRAFGCNFGFNQFGTNQIDTFSVIDNDDQVIVNSNDCPYEIGQSTAKMIKQQYSGIDFIFSRIYWSF